MRLCASALTKLARKVDRAVEAQGAVIQNINVLRLEVGGGIDNTDIARLHEVVGDEQVLLVRRDLDVMRADDGLVLIRVIQTLHVAQVADVQRRDMVGRRQRKVGEPAVLGEVGVDGDGVAGLGAKVVQQLGDALVALRVLAEGVDDPDLAEVDGGGEGGALRVARDELDVLDAAAVGDGDGAEDGAGLQVPQAQSVGAQDLERRLEDAERHDEVGCQDDVLVPVDAQAVRAELLAQDVEQARNVFGPLVDDVEVGVGLDEAAGRGADGGAHVRDEEAAVCSVSLLRSVMMRLVHAYPSGLARISSVMEPRMPRLLFRNFGWYGSLVSK